MSAGGATLPALAAGAGAQSDCCAKTLSIIGAAAGLGDAAAGGDGGMAADGEAGCSPLVDGWERRPACSFTTCKSGRRRQWDRSTLSHLCSKATVTLGETRLFTTHACTMHFHSNARLLETAGGLLGCPSGCSAAPSPPCPGSASGSPRWAGHLLASQRPQALPSRLPQALHRNHFCHTTSIEPDQPPTYWKALVFSSRGSLRRAWHDE